jgi:hypothetical protein
MGFAGASQDRQSGRSSPAAVFNSGAPALPFVPATPLVPDESNVSLDERFEAAFPVRRLSSGLPSR